MPLPLPLYSCRPGSAILETYLVVFASNGSRVDRVHWSLVVADRRSVRVVAAARGTTTATVATAVSSSSSGRVATRRASIATAHGRSTAVATVRATTATRSTATSAATAAVHARKVGSLGDDL